MNAELQTQAGPEEYLAPATLAEAVQALADGQSTVVAGGTDLMVQTREGRKTHARRLVNIRRVAGLSGVETDGSTIRIGALTTMTEILSDPALTEVAPVLAQAADHFASNQIRNAATIGGNICNASPAGDSIPPLMVLDASVELTSWKDGALAVRSVPIAEFFTGPGQTVKTADELLTAVFFAAPAPGFEAEFIKSGPRPALEISTVSAALGARRDNGTLGGVRIALGAVGPTPLRARRTEAFLEGKAPDADIAAEAARIAADEATPIDDVRASAWYRRHLVGVYIRRLLGQ